MEGVQICVLVRAKTPGLWLKLNHAFVKVFLYILYTDPWLTTEKDNPWTKSQFSLFPWEVFVYRLIAALDS